MGFYIEVPDTLKHKAKLIEETLHARRITQAEAEEIVKDVQKAVICVVENDLFDAAAFCYSSDEFDRFSEPNDPRRKTWLVINNRSMIEKMTGFVPG
jgi:hypothetical protein